MDERTGTGEAWAVEWDERDGAFPISQDERDKWVAEMLGELRQDPAQSYAGRRSGDSYVVVRRDELGLVDVLDCLVRRTGAVSESLSQARGEGAS